MTRVAKWGNSLAVRLPQSTVEMLALEAGAEVTIIPIGRRELGVERPMTREEAIAHLRASRIKLPDDYKFDREEANAR